MTFDEKWEQVHQEREWGHCPEPCVARFVGRHLADRKPPVRVLDLGCGVGANTHWLAAEGFYVDAVDGSPSAIDRLRRNSHRALAVANPGAGSVTTLVADVCDLPYGDNVFDAVIDVCCLQHVVEIEQAMVHVRRVLKPGGWFISMMASPGHTTGAFKEMWARRITASQLFTLLGQDDEAPWFQSTTVDNVRRTDRYDVIEHWIIQQQKAKGHVDRCNQSPNHN